MIIPNITNLYEEYCSNHGCLEDVPFDMESHKDSEGNSYDFGFGLNWKGVIKDNRTIKYQKK